MWNSLKDILPSVAKKYSMKRTLDAIDVCREYRSIAPKLLPKDALRNTHAKSYKDNTLTISVGSPVWAQEIHMRRHLLKDELNRRYGEDTVRNIRIMITDEPIGDNVETAE
jgi:predicted nucleic acid-binding Zn ribbon protein